MIFLLSLLSIRVTLQAWSNLYGELAELFGEGFSASNLPSGLDSEDKAGPAVSLTLSPQKFEFAGEASADIVVGAAPFLSQLLPSGKIKWEVSAEAVKFDATLKSPLSSYQVRLDLDLSPLSLNEFYISLDYEPLYDFAKDAVKKTSQEVYDLCEFLDVWNSLRFSKFFLQFKAGVAELGTDMTIFSKQISLRLKLDFQAIVEGLVKLFRGDFSGLSKLATSMYDALKEKVGADPCACAEPCRARYKTTFPVMEEHKEKVPVPYWGRCRVRYPCGVKCPGVFHPLFTIPTVQKTG